MYEYILILCWVIHGKALLHVFKLPGMFNKNNICQHCRYTHIWKTHVWGWGHISLYGCSTVIDGSKKACWYWKKKKTNPFFLQGCFFIWAKATWHGIYTAVKGVKNSGGLHLRGNIFQCSLLLKISYYSIIYREALNKNKKSKWVCQRFDFILQKLRKTRQTGRWLEAYIEALEKSPSTSFVTWFPTARDTPLKALWCSRKGGWVSEKMRKTHSHLRAHVFLLIS